MAALGVTCGGLMLTGLDGLAVTSTPEDRPGFLSGRDGACFAIGDWLGVCPRLRRDHRGKPANGVTEAGCRSVVLVALALLAVGAVTAPLIRRPEPEGAAGGERFEERPLPVPHH
ncbi:hypothetical protein [Streptomyces sp. NPDC049887]|uniref:hypothetical protein n=1 Tax=unclassified Streptomyces TaxID=2593676 RepID=UPI003426761F